ncbi:MAG TPA: hypothetical protein VJQ55_11580 [Candidatus Binatia bacterium]|nr:hypothetical protein [Candidatus Binatia bacterium]
MKLRDHPLMIRNSGIVSWPPEWQPIGRKGSVRGEIGILDDVSMHNLIANKIFLAAQHLSDRYVTVLAFDDEIFAKQLYPLLLENIGRSIQEIGELEISHLL